MSEIKPVTRGEAYWAAMSDDSITPPEPQTTEECYLAAMSGNYDGELPEPQTREQVFMKKAAVKMSENGGGDNNALNTLIDRTITDINNNEVTSIGAYAFYGCQNLNSVNFPKVTEIGQNAFYKCQLSTVNLPLVEKIEQSGFSSSGIRSAEFPSLTSLGTFAFQGCGSLVKVNIPLITEVTTSAFQGCPRLTFADFKSAQKIGMSGLKACIKLESLILRRTEGVCTLYNASSIADTLIANGTGYVYVPSELVDTYKEDIYWNTYATQIRAIEDYPEICG